MLSPCAQTHVVSCAVHFNETSRRTCARTNMQSTYFPSRKIDQSATQHHHRISGKHQQAPPSTSNYNSNSNSASEHRRRAQNVRAKSTNKFTNCNFPLRCNSMQFFLNGSLARCRDYFHSCLATNGNEIKCKDTHTHTQFSFVI